MGMTKKAPMLVRAVALLLGLAILGAVWTILTYVTWGVFTFFGSIGGQALSVLIIACGLLSYLYVAVRLFWGDHAKDDHREAVRHSTDLSNKLVAAGVFPMTGSGARGWQVDARGGAERAVALAQSWARHVGAPSRAFDASEDMAFGETGLAYDAAEDTLYGRVYVNMALVKGMDPEAIAVQRRMVRALNDPEIGGMYDRGGGSFVLDEAREAWYLVRAFPVATTSPANLKTGMKRMQTVAATWTAKWFFDVAMIMHGKEKPPTTPQVLPD